MCDAAADREPQSLSLILHSGRVSITLAQFPVPRFDDGCALGDEIARAVRQILEGKCNPNE